MRSSPSASPFPFSNINNLFKNCTAGHGVVTEVSSGAPALPCTEQRQHVCPLTSRPAHHTEASRDQSTHAPMQTSMGPRLLRLQVFCVLVELWERPEQILCALWSMTAMGGAHVLRRHACHWAQTPCCCRPSPSRGLCGGRASEGI